MMFWYGAHWAFWQAGLMWAGMIVFWGLLIWGSYALITTAMRRPDRRDEDGGGAQRILDERLARGEIDSDGYRLMRDLMHNAAQELQPDHGAANDLYCGDRRGRHGRPAPAQRADQCISRLPQYLDLPD